MTGVGDAPAVATSRELLLLDPGDNTLAVRRPLTAGTDLLIDGYRVRIDRELPVGHKVSRVDLPVGSHVRKYGAVIGTTIAEVRRGEHLHTHNFTSNYIPAHLRGGTETTGAKWEGTTA
ncbi:UxaA family hydrolase [Mycobacterium sp. NPDC003449]